MYSDQNSNTCISACQLSLALECVCTQLQELSSLGAALDHTPTLLGAASEGQVSYLSPRPGSRRHMGPQPRRHPQRGFPLPHLPPLPTSVSRDYLRKPNRKSVSSQKKRCLSERLMSGSLHQLKLNKSPVRSRIQEEALAVTQISSISSVPCVVASVTSCPLPWALATHLCED